MSLLVNLTSLTVKLSAERSLNYPGFEIRASDRLMISGASGSGKTTLLHLISGLITPTEGYVHLTTRNIGYVFQEPRLIPHLTPVQNICLVNQKKPNAHAIALKLLEDAGLQDVTTQRSDNLSGGEAQRVNLLRGLFCEPDLLLIDEVGSSLDEVNWKLIRNIYKRETSDRPIAIVEVAHGSRRLITNSDNTELVDLKS